MTQRTLTDAPAHKKCVAAKLSFKVIQDARTASHRRSLCCGSTELQRKPRSSPSAWWMQPVSLAWRRLDAAHFDNPHVMQTMFCGLDCSPWMRSLRWQVRVDACADMACSCSANMLPQSRAYVSHFQSLLPTTGMPDGVLLRQQRETPACHAASSEVQQQCGRAMIACWPSRSLHKWL